MAESDSWVDVRFSRPNLGPIQALGYFTACTDNSHVHSYIQLGTAPWPDVFEHVPLVAACTFAMYFGYSVAAVRARLPRGFEEFDACADKGRMGPLAMFWFGRETIESKMAWMFVNGADFETLVPYWVK